MYVSLTINYLKKPKVIGYPVVKDVTKERTMEDLNLE